ncbi:hypothetical protein [Candidatus Methylopumilus turicensis]|jgi:hypothetical protein|uniref:Uncharacterized protein n=1 Tax=Candidatus Methylopumilus turicensis TaxID=1581680 RepID=A0A0B7IWN2_9PROT|nr:hypothetical protein [Candidatus Methylopumilus turicensis]CEN56692.1 conserved protein of unknown function [Candidatus Methylopumilus turicensis]
MAKDNGGRQSQLRQLVAQQAARMMAEDGVSDYGYAKKKAGRQLGVVDANCLPSNAEIEEEIRLFHEIYNSDDQPEALRILRQDALATMQIFARFNPHLTGSVLDGTAGQYAETNIHLFADSAKDVEIFLLNQQIPYDSNDKSYRVRDRKSGDKKTSGKNSERLKVPMFTLEGPNGFIKLSVFEFDDIRFSTKSVVNGGNADRVDAEGLRILLNQNS